MSEQEFDERRAFNHYITNIYLSSKSASKGHFTHLPECEKLPDYYDFVKKVKEDTSPLFKNCFLMTFFERISYAESEKAFREMLSEEQNIKFQELREQIIAWYEIQKKALEYEMIANNPAKYE